MSTWRALGIVLLAYGLVCVIAGASKLPLLWNMSNVQLFVNGLGAAGAQALVVGWGLIVVSLGIWLTFIKRKTARQALGSVTLHVSS